MMWPMEYMGLKRIEALLTCGICYEYMDTTMITSCSHNYCSLCIRKYLHYKTQCPNCSEETFEKDLRKNKILDEIIEQYLNIKEQLNKKSCGEETPIAKNKDSRPMCSSSSYEYEKKVSDTTEVLSKASDSPVLGAGTPSTPCGRKDHQQDISTPSTSTDLRIPLMFTPKSRKGFRNQENCEVVSCPVCKVDVPQDNINKHLDNCLKRENAKNQPQSTKPQRKPLPKLVLSLMKDNVMRKKLKELGLSSQGDRKALESRLQRYTILYNAECDKANPRPVSELIKQCEEEENLERKVQKPSNRLNVNRNTEHNVIEQQRKKYLAENKESFKHLITKIKHVGTPRKLPVRRNILSRNNSDVSYKDCIVKKSPRTSEKSDFLPSDNPHIDDLDSNASCPLQMYSSEDPRNFLTIELSSSSNDSIDQCAPNDVASCRKTNLLSCNTVVKKEIIETDESLENILTHAEMTYSLSRRNISEDSSGSNAKEAIGEFENRDEVVLSAKRRKRDVTYSENSKKYITHSESKGRWQKALRDEDSIVENSDNDMYSDDDIQDNYEKPRHEQLHANVKEKYESGSRKFEKENLESLTKKRDEIRKVCVFRKRERERMIVLSDEEKNGDKSIGIRKSARLGLSEAKSFNNEIFCDDTRNEEEKPQSEKRELRATRAKNPHIAKKTVKLKNGISKSMKKITM